MQSKCYMYKNLPIDINISCFTYFLFKKLFVKLKIKVAVTIVLKIKMQFFSYN